MSTINRRLAVGNDTGMAVIDILKKTRLFAFACPDLYGQRRRLMSFNVINKLFRL